MSNSATPDPERKKGGPWANRQVISEVEHTPEWEAFIKELQEYHDKRGTHLTPEPELGRKLLDLRKLYKIVTDLGGYDKLTETKGAWRDLANQYKPPVNNTNAGYLLKTIYYKNLAAYEISNFFHKEPPPKEFLEDRSAAGGAIMTRKPEDFVSARSPKSELNGDSQSPPPTETRRSLRAAPTPRTRYAPEATPTRTSTRSASQQRNIQQQQPQQQQQQQQQQQPQTQPPPMQHQMNNHPPQTPVQHQQPLPYPPHYQQQHPPQTPQQFQQYQRPPVPNVTAEVNQFFPDTQNFPTFQEPVNQNAIVPHPVVTPRTAPENFVFRRRRIQEQNGYLAATNGQRIGTGHTGATLMYRVLMGLKSGLPDQVTYSLDQLVRLSHDVGDELVVAAWPGLADILWDKVREVRELANDRSHHGEYDLVDSREFRKKMELLNQAALIVRNLAMNEANANFFAYMPGMMDTLVMALTLPPHPDFTEFRSYILDTVDATANFLPYHGGEALFAIISNNLMSDDRSTIISSLRAACRYTMGRDEDNRIGTVPFPTISRLTSLLMLEDDELVCSVLDFLYQYTTVEENVERLLAPPLGPEVVKHLTRLLLFQGITGEQLVYIKAHRKLPPPIHDIPTLPREIVDELLTFSEPERATRWMRCCFEEDPEADITQIALWQAYQARFTEFVATGYPLLPAAEFIKNVSVAFATASAMVLPTPQGQKFIIKGIRARETPMGLKGNIYLACKWHDPATLTPCRAMLATPAALWQHVLAAHLPTTAAPPLFCSWSGCNRFGVAGSKNRLAVVGHVRTHMPNDVARPPSLPREEQEMMDDPEGRVIIKRCQTVVDERGEAGGIPLTSVLVLRNLKRRGGERGRELLAMRKEGLFEVMAVNQPLAGWVADLVLGD